MELKVIQQAQGVAVTGPTIVSLGIAEIKTVSNADYTILDDDGYYLILTSATSANRTITLPDAANNTGRRIMIKRTDATAAYYVTVSGTIEGNTVHRLFQQYGYLEVISDGTSWFYASPFLEQIALTITKSGGYDATEITNLADSGSSYSLRFLGQRVGKNIILGVTATFDSTTGNGLDTIDVPLADISFLSGYTVSNLLGSFYTNMNGGLGTTPETYRSVGGIISLSTTNMRFTFTGNTQASGNRSLAGTLVIQFT